MEHTATFSCRVGTTDNSAKLGLEIWFDEHKIFDQEHVQQTETVEYEFADADGEHTVQFVMKNKTAELTQVDETGAILSDACITVADVSFDDIALGHAFTELAEYRHDFNGTQDPVVARFYGEMGCNGVISLRFTTPIYLWILEHL